MAKMHQFSLFSGTHNYISISLYSYSTYLYYSIYLYYNFPIEVYLSNI